MKKIIGTLSVLALVGASAFADIAIGGWGRSGINLFEKSGSSDATVTGTPSWAQIGRVGVNFSASTEDNTFGFLLNVDSNAADIGIGDNAKIWANLGFFKFQFGKIQLDDLRGSIGDWGNRQAIAVAGEDDLFKRFYPTQGMTVSMTPIEGLFMGAAINIDQDTTTSTYTSSADDVYRSIQVGAGYTIKDTAQLKAQYIGSTKAEDSARAEFGADILAIPNLLIESGVKVPIGAKADKTKITIAENYSKDAIASIGHVVVQLTDTLYTAADLELEYALDPVTIGVNGGFTHQSTSTFGGEVYLKKAYSNGYLFGGVADTYDTSDSTNTISIPVGVEYWF